MTRDQAVQRINQGIGFRPAGNPLESTIVLMLQEAQRDLEHGKTLPRFLLMENQVLVLLNGTRSIAFPTGFLRDSDETRIRITMKNGVGLQKPVFLSRRYLIDAFQAYRDLFILEAPKVYIIRQSTVLFPNNADADYSLTLDYYKADDILSSNIENKWLANAPEWLIGEAGYRLAMDLRDADAVAKFDRMRQQGRAASFGDDLARELSSQPLEMGANL